MALFTAIVACVELCNVFKAKLQNPLTLVEFVWNFGDNNILGCLDF